MSKILLWSGPEGYLAWDISTPERRGESYLALFNHLDSLGMYEKLDSASYQIYEMAKRGNHKFAEALLVLNNGSVNETFQEVFIKNPAPAVVRKIKKVEVPANFNFDVPEAAAK